MGGNDFQILLSLPFDADFPSKLVSEATNIQSVSILFLGKLGKLNTRGKLFPPNARKVRNPKQLYRTIMFNESAAFRRRFLAMFPDQANAAGWRIVVTWISFPDANLNAPLISCRLQFGIRTIFDQPVSLQEFSPRLIFGLRLGSSAIRQQSTRTPFGLSYTLKVKRAVGKWRLAFTGIYDAKIAPIALTAGLRVRPVLQDPSFCAGCKRTVLVLRGNRKRSRNARSAGHYSTSPVAHSLPVIDTATHTALVGF